MSTEAPSVQVNPLDAVRCHSKTDIGQKREENQDSFGAAISENFKFYFVCDGMGGVKGGAVASQLAVSVIEKACSALGTLNVETIRAAVSEANTSIFDRGTNDEQLSGMGTTFVGLAYIGTRMLITSVGDSRAYRVRGGEISQLTEDHTLVMELLRSGSITEEQAVNHPVSHMLTRSLGPAPEIEIDCWESPDAPKPGDKYLLCSDGLYNMLGIEELCEVILSLPPEEIVEELVSLANLRGGHDNITVMLISIDENYPQSTTTKATTTKVEPVITLSADESELYEEDQVAEDEALLDSEQRVDEPAAEPSTKEHEGTGFTLKGQGKNSRLGSATDQVVRASVRLQPGRASAPTGSQAHDLARKSNRQPESAVSGGDSADAAQTRAGLAGERASGVIPAGSRTQARFLVVLLAGLAGAYLLGHLHGTTDEEIQLSRNVSEKSVVSRIRGDAAVQDATVQRSASIAVAPIAIQPIQEPAPDQELEIGLNPRLEPEQNTNLLDAQADERRQQLSVTISDLEQKLAAFRSPISGKAGEMLRVSTSQIERISRDLDSARAQIDAATRALTIWLGRKKRLQSGDPINLASEVSVSSDAVKAKQEIFNQVTYSFLQENEVLRFNPGDKARERRVADLARQRLTVMRELIDSVKRAIQDELAKVEKQIELSTLNRVDLEAQLEQARRDVEYVKALAGSDVKAREAKQLELQRLIDVARAELDELNRGNP